MIGHYGDKVGRKSMLVLTLIAIGAPVTAIWMLVDLVVLGVGSFRDGRGRRMRRWV